MPNLTPLDPATLTGNAKAMVESVQQQIGRLPAMVRLMVNSPAALEGYLGFTRALQSTSLGDELQAMIGVTVAQTVGNDYAIGIADTIARRAGVTPEKVAAAKSAVSREAETDAALKFAHDLVQGGGHLPRGRVQALKQAGLTDAQVVDLVATTCLTLYRSYFNLVAGTEVDFPAPALAQ